MKIEDIIKLENSNEDAIILLKEGMFWRAYERSSHRFIRLIKEYQLNVKHYKSVNRRVVYLGFPAERLPNVLAHAKLKGWRTIEKNPGIWWIEGIPAIEGYDEWKSQLPEKPIKAKGDTSQHHANEILEIHEVSTLPVYKDAYDLMLEIFQFSKQFQREYRFTLGERLKNEVLDMLIMIYEAQTGHQRHEKIFMARKHAELARLLIRLTKDLHLIDLKRFIRLNEKIEDILRQLSGWLKVQTQCRSPVGQGQPE